MERPIDTFPHITKTRSFNANARIHGEEEEKNMLSRAVIEPMSPRLLVGRIDNFTEATTLATSADHYTDRFLLEVNMSRNEITTSVTKVCRSK